ncbi:hypothetical protein NECAME_14027 [Necator americanus]|uniref:Uncharacterized protein n=1 Tax=Necator americanus TaxID=51031 RepID=W2STF5_NECAM|nr:hypothetical protein NECAME_14027 [Necator americanus]ETN71982.1 hypothetical protein NECAME_14027 [Necator americanus]
MKKTRNAAIDWNHSCMLHFWSLPVMHTCKPCEEHEQVILPIKCIFASQYLYAHPQKYSIAKHFFGVVLAWTSYSV